MSFTTKKPAHEDLSQTALHLQLSRKSASAPAFRPQIVRSLRMHPVIAASVAAVVLVGLVAFAMFQKSVYLAISQVFEEPASPKLLSDPSAALFDANRYETFLGEQIQLVQRLDVLTAAMNSLPSATYREFGATPAQAAEAIQAQMKVVRVATSYQMSISLKGTDPQKTADIVNAITAAYLGAVQKANAAEYDQRAQLLGEERQRIETELQAARAEQTALGASIGVANPTGTGGNPYDEELSGIRSQLVEARAAHDLAAAQLASLSGVGPSRTDGLTAAADELIAGDAGLGSMKATISSRKAQLNEQMSGMTPSNPIYKQDQDQIADLDRTLDRMTNELRDKAARRLQDKLRADLQRTGDIESRLNAQLARQIATATSAAPRLQRASEVAADIQRLDTRMAAVDDALRGLRLEVSGPAQVRLSLAATPPEVPEANRRKQLLLLALPLALLCGIAAAILARKQNRRIYGGVDIDDVLGFPPLAVLPARADVSQRVFEEYVLRLAAGIESAYRTSGARTFLLTAVSLTTDIRPLATALTRKFEEIGVNVIVATASDMLSPTDGVPSAGAEPMTAGELAHAVELWSEGFVAANVAKMKAEHGLVLIESEALLNCAQTEYVARCADATILIVECGVTTRQELFRAAELLHRLNVTGIAAVLEEIQLRHADSDFRRAIDALDRRQAESPRQDRRTVPQVIPTEAKPEQVDDIVPPIQETLIAVPAAATVPEFTTAPEPVAERTAQDQTLMETEGDRVELQYEPAHYHEVLHHVRATRPVHDDSGWQLPVFSQVPVAASPVPTAAWPAASNLSAEVPEAVVPQQSPLAEPAVAALVENTVDIPVLAAGTVVSTVAIDAANDSLHEKMTPRLSARRDEPTFDGEPGMTRRTSWIGKLLRRDSAPVVSILPVAGDDPEDDSAPSAALSSPPVLVTQGKPQAPVDDYDASLASRIQQISGSWPAAVAPASTPTTDIAEFKESHRLQVTQAEPIEAEPTPPVIEAAPELAAVESVAPIADAPVPPRVRRGPAAWATADQAIEDTEIPLPSPTLAESPRVAEPEPRRPLSFKELMALTARQATAPAEVVPAQTSEPQAVIEEAPKVELANARPLAAEANAPEPMAFPILGHVSEYFPVAATVESVEPEPVAEANVEPEVKHLLSAQLPVTVEQAPTVAEALVFAPIPEPLPQPVPEFAATAEPVRTQEPVAEPMAAEVPEFHFSNRYLEESKRQRDEPPAHDPYRPNPYELDDIEPVYQEASRSLNTGPWDPIPPLRPSMNSWRDRPSPVPTNGNGRSHYRQGAVQDAFNSYPPQRWIPEEIPPAAPEPEPLSEPMLSRQWGLLSKFQQSRLSSSSRPDANSAEAPESSRNADRTGSPYGDRRS